MNNEAQFNTKKFIDAVRSSRALWDPRDKGFVQRRNKQFEWSQIGRYFRITPSQAGQKWLYLHNKYKKERQKIKSDWQFFDQLRFLETQINYRPEPTKPMATKEINAALTKYGAAPQRRPQIKSPIILNKNFTPKTPVELKFQTTSLSSSTAVAVTTPAPTPTPTPPITKTNKRARSNSNEMIEPIMLNYATSSVNLNGHVNKTVNSNKKIIKVEKIQQRDDTNAMIDEQDAISLQDEFEFDENIDYKSRCRTFAKYFGEELCMMEPDVGDAYILDMLKIITDEKVKRLMAN